MKLMREEWPKTLGTRIGTAARWAFSGIILGGVAYLVLWQFMEPVGQPPGAAMALVNLVTSPWAWAFLALCAFSMALIPVMALRRGVEMDYNRALYFLLRVWTGGLLLMGMAVVLAYRLAFRARTTDWVVVDLFTLSIPTALALAVLIFGYRGLGK